MNILQGQDLSRRNTLGVPSRARYSCNATTTSELVDALVWASERNLEVFVLGGGSNVILAPELNGLVLTPAITGKRVVKKDEHFIWVKFGAGEQWHHVVQWCLQQGYYGLENLALIPGSIGAAPVQNIGAYGVELEQFFSGLTALHKASGELKKFGREDCHFAYRESVFKGLYKDQYIITDVTLKLSLAPVLNLNYPVLAEALRGSTPSPQAIFDAVCRLRSERLPVPQVTPNSGSFFKNPVVSLDEFEKLQDKNPDVVGFDTPCKTKKKLAAAWLIDRAGWKGKTRYGVGVHSKQALVLINPERGPAQAVLRLAADIQQSVLAKFNVTLELEPQRMGFDDANRPV